MVWFYVKWWHILRMGNEMQPADIVWCSRIITESRVLVHIKFSCKILILSWCFMIHRRGKKSKYWRNIYEKLDSSSIVISGVLSMVIVSDKILKNAISIFLTMTFYKYIIYYKYMSCPPFTGYKIVLRPGLCTTLSNNIIKNVISK